MRLGDQVCRRAEATRISQEPGEEDESRAASGQEGDDGPEASSARPAAVARRGSWVSCLEER